ncbi:MAG TPA: response regulator, partial [Blastocatellia bacterium]|nr:response regulator [Blastocatellia bacterium]
MAKILVVDDQPFNRKLFVSLLGHEDHLLFEASDGVEALKLARDEHPDLIISDILMPTMDGFEFVHRLRADPAIATTRVIFTTASYLDREARTIAEACGVSVVLTRPCELETIRRTVETALRTAPGP